MPTDGAYSGPVWFIGPESKVYHRFEHCPALRKGHRYWPVKHGHVNAEGAILTTGAQVITDRRLCGVCAKALEIEKRPPRPPVRHRSSPFRFRRIPSDYYLSHWTVFRDGVRLGEVAHLRMGGWRTLGWASRDGYESRYEAAVALSNTPPQS